MKVGVVGMTQKSTNPYASEGLATTNQHLYLEVQRCLREDVWRKYPDHIHIHWPLKNSLSYSTFYINQI